MNESEVKVNEWNNEQKIGHLRAALNNANDHLIDMEERVIALEGALEALLKKEEMSKLNLHGGDGEWY